MSSPFSLLIEWVTSPQVVGSFTIGGIGLLLMAISIWFCIFASKRDDDDLAVICALCLAVVFLVTVICFIAFNMWVEGV